MQPVPPLMFNVKAEALSSPISMADGEIRIVEPATLAVTVIRLT